MAKRILLISWSIPPARTGSAVIIDNLSRGFRSDEMVVAGQGCDDFRESRPPAAPPVLAVQSHRRWNLFGHGEHYLALLRVPRLLARLERVALRERCDAVVGVYPDASFFLASYLLARKLRLPFFPYMHNTFLESRRPGPMRRLALWLQPRAFAYATHVFTMSEGMSELYRDLYGSQFRHSPLPHSFSEEIPAFREPRWGSPLVVGFSGNINASCQDAARRLFEAVRRSGDARVRFFSPARKEELIAAGVWVEGGELRCLARDELLAGLRECDVLLLPHGFTGGYHPVEYKTIFPTKTIEYLLAGRPILAHSPPGAYLTTFLKSAKCALVVEEPTVEAVLAGLETLRRDAGLRRQLVRSALAAAARFRIDTVATHVRKVVGLGNTIEQAIDCR